MREKAGLTQAEVAVRMGTAQPNVSRLERLPVQEISQRQLRRYLAALEAGLVLLATTSAGDEVLLTSP
ncbi:XRE family transcriptional regulator [Streptomyces sp. NPDC001743]|uniref:XRE family transcriptional regulator n=1 Tax=Streptomyces sp. NPDC001743 TaxID=3154397 RepID=UPI0033263C74